MDGRQHLGQLLLAGILMLAAAGATIETLDQTGQITIRETQPGQLDIYDARSDRRGYGIQRQDGSWDLYNRDGSRIGYTQPGRSGQPDRIILSPTKRR